MSDIESRPVSSGLRAAPGASIKYLKQWCVGMRAKHFRFLIVSKTLHAPDPELYI